MNSDLYYHKVEVPVVTSFVCEVTIATSKFLSYGELKPGFHMSGKSQTIGDFAVSRLSQILPTNENSKS